MPVRHFWIVTPSFNSRSWLPCAVASVADQAGDGSIQVHHHVQDGGSRDGTREWLEDYARQCAAHPRPGYTFSYESSHDEGMYDAINKGWEQAPSSVDFLGHLNSDEQYLPGGLAAIAASFEKHPSWEVILADMFVVDSAGQYICHRRSLNFSRLSFRYNTGGMTAATFQRASVFQDRGIQFELGWRVIADKVWYFTMAQAGVSFGCENQLVSVFAETGNNLGWSPAVAEEARRYADQYLIGGLRGIYVMSKCNVLRRVLKELFIKPPQNYAIYTAKSLPHRQDFTIAKPTIRWGKKLTLS